MSTDVVLQSDGQIGNPGKKPEENLSQQRPHPGRDTLIQTSTFVGTLALAYFSGWSTKDMIWSLWLSSLLAGFLTFIAQPVRQIFQPDRTSLERAFSVIGTLGALVFFTAHFGFFHYIYASILDLPLPLMEHPGRVYLGKLTWTTGVPFSFRETLGLAVSQYWLVALMNVARDRHTIFEEVEAKKNLGPYRAILKLHFVVMGLGACYGLGLDSFPVYALVFSFLYTPAGLWRKIFRRDSKQRHAGDVE